MTTISNRIIHMEKSNEKTPSLHELVGKKLKNRLESKQKELEKAITQLKQVASENEILKKQLKQYTNPKDEYNYSRTWISKIVFIVTRADKPLRSAEIIALLLKNEPVLNEKTSKEKFISPFLNSAMQYKRLIPYKLKGVRGNYYCLPEWINDEGELLPEMKKQIY